MAGYAFCGEDCFDAPKSRPCIKPRASADPTRFDLFACLWPRCLPYCNVFAASNDNPCLGRSNRKVDPFTRSTSFIPLRQQLDNRYIEQESSGRSLSELLTTHGLIDTYATYRHTLHLVTLLRVPLLGSQPGISGFCQIDTMAAQVAVDYLHKLLPVVAEQFTVSNATTTQNSLYGGLDLEDLGWLERTWASYYIWMGNPVIATGVMSFLMHEVSTMVLLCQEELRQCEGD